MQESDTDAFLVKIQLYIELAAVKAASSKCATGYLSLNAPATNKRLDYQIKRLLK